MPVKPPVSIREVAAHADLIALGLLQELTRQRIRVPDDVAIIGYDDIEFAASAAVPLSSIHQPRQVLGRTAAQLLVAETLGTDAHQHRQVIFEPELVVRPSSQMKARRAQLLARSPSTAEAAG
jgi:LacI family transcriptional regulator, galactose operon repressor